MTGAKTEKQDVVNSLTNEEWVLSLLHANNGKPMNGKLMFVKQLFILANDIFPDLSDRFKFYPSHYGPYSNVFARTVKELIKEDLIKVDTETDGKTITYIFTLTEKGKEKAKSAFEELPQNYQETMSRKRRGWDQLGYRGIVRFVYTKYPEYTTKSKILDMIK